MIEDFEIPDRRIEKALTVLAETAEPVGMLHGRKEALEKLLKGVHAQQAMKSGASSMSEASVKGYASPEYMALLDEYNGVCIDFRTIQAKRDLEEAVIEVWRTQNANKRKGNL